MIVETPFRPEEFDALLDLPPERGVFRVHAYSAPRNAEAWIVTGVDPRVRIRVRGDRARVERRGRPDLAGRLHPLALVDAAAALLPRRRPVADLPFPGGAIGFLGYGLRTHLEDVPATRPEDTPFPDLYWAVPDLFWTWPRGGRTVFAVAWVAPGVPRKVVIRRLRDRASIPTAGAENSASGVRGRLRARSNFTRRRYLATVERVREYIRAGDIYQANLTQRFRVSPTRPPGEVFRALSSFNPAPFAAFLALREGVVLSVSPERFLRLDGRQAMTEPIKGTRPRGTDPRTDRVLAQALRASAKDRAELAIIVDLERNDLGRVCRAGSVRVAEACRLESHPTVHHLVATVCGELRRGARLSEVLAATFPGGSVTGAPKIRAMEILDELEPTARGVYTGALGTIGCDGRVDLSLCIRVLLATKDSIVFPVGGGVVIDSDPAAEYAETLAKAAAQARAVGARPPGDAGRAT